MLPPRTTPPPALHLGALVLFSSTIRRTVGANDHRQLGAQGRVSNTHRHFSNAPYPRLCPLTLRPVLPRLRLREALTRRSVSSRPMRWSPPAPLGSSHRRRSSATSRSALSRLLTLSEHNHYRWAGSTRNRSTEVQRSRITMLPASSYSRSPPDHSLQSAPAAAPTHALAQIQTSPHRPQWHVADTIFRDRGLATVPTT